MALKAMIFDVDGTLVDTNQAHVEAWRRAFQRCGFDVPAERIWPEVGKGGDMLVPAILDEKAEAEHGETLREYYGEEFLQIATTERFVVFPQVPQLFQTLRERGLKTALATSAQMKYLEAIQKSAGVDLQAMADFVVNADDTENSKPAPDLVIAAVEKLGFSSAECVMLGDTPHDAEACRRAGVVCLGVRTGGHATETLVSAGARAVWQDVADLLIHLDEALALVS